MPTGLALANERPTTGASPAPRRIAVMRARSRLLTAIAALLLVAMYFLPLWSIQLAAPQYPEGLGMYIRLSTIEGSTPFDLAKINGLNHYIGMKPITPEAIPELKVMPWIVAAIMAGGLMVAVSGRRRLLYLWLAAFALLGVAGLADFYRWSYDYGHNLDAESAIIEVPGMSYQPPLIGSKQLLNFRATSWPASGGLLAGLSFALGAVAAVLAWRDARGRVWGRSGLVPVAVFSAIGLPAVGQAQHAQHVHRAPAPDQPVAVALPSGERPAAPGARAATITVSPDGRVRRIGDAIRMARPGDRIVIAAGTYREPTLVIEKPLEIIGEGWPVIDGSGAGQIMSIGASDVTIRGLVLRNVATSFVEDRAAIRVTGASRCVIDRNRIENSFFGIYLAGVTGCRITDNTIRGTVATEAASGNGIHLWSSRDVVVEGNRISGHRDGIYLEFARSAVVRGNTSERNLRYGLHFMYSDDCEYVANDFVHNLAGVAVMYARRVAMTDNRFADNRGSASYGLLLKEIADARIERNRFTRNTVGLLADGAVRIVATDNEFTSNGWALKLMASTYDGRFERNDFIGNTFDVTTNGREATNRLTGNHFDDYRGYDLDRDGFGDVPHRPVRLSSVLVERNAPSVILLRSTFLALLDAAERVLPVLTPAQLVDGRPAMRALRPGGRTP